MDLIVYEKKNGTILMQRHDETEITECGSLLVSVPEDKELIGINPETEEPIFIDRPLTLEERLAALESSQTDQDDAIDALAGALGGDE